MFRSLITGRVVTALVAGGILAVAQLSGPATVTTAPAIENVAKYPEGVVTDTDVSVARREMTSNQTNRATARVTSGDGTPQGTVTFRLSGHGSERVALVNGRASYDIPRGLAPGRYTVTARYNGEGVYKKSSDSASFTVVRSGRGDVGDGNGNGRGGDDSGGGAGDGNGGGSGDGSGNGTAGGGNGDADGTGTAGGEGDLPSTGAEGNTILFTLMGLGLLALGATTLAGRRRFLSRS